MCTLDYALQYCKSTGPAQKFISLPAWHKVTEADVHNYHLLPSDKLRKIHIPCEVLACVDPNCSVHTKEICTFYDNITLALISACNESIPFTKPTRGKSMPGWNDYVREHFRAALFWHNIWVDNERPAEGVVAEVRHSTRRTYHKVCKMAMRHAGEIACDKMARSIRCNSMR